MNQLLYIEIQKKNNMLDVQINNVNSLILNYLDC